MLFYCCNFYWPMHNHLFPNLWNTKHMYLSKAKHFYRVNIIITPITGSSYIKRENYPNWLFFEKVFLERRRYIGSNVTSTINLRDNSSKRIDLHRIFIRTSVKYLFLVAKLLQNYKCSSVRMSVWQISLGENTIFSAPN